MRNVKTREGFEYWDKICSLKHYGFLHSPDGKRVVKTEGIGNWIDKFEAQEIVDQAQDEINQYRAERDALQQRLTAADEELDQCRSMALMIEEREWAEHVGAGPISSRVESAFTQMHNELSEARQALTAADERADVLEGLLRTSLVAMSRIYSAGRDFIVGAGSDCDSVELMMENDPTAREIRAALKPAAPATDEHVCNGCGAKGWTANCKECVPY